MTTEEQDRLADSAGNQVYAVAEQIFADCMCLSDFCLQTSGYGSIVFGKTNRLAWSAQKGWKPLPSHCTPQFMHAWERIKHEYTNA